jgi:hypothetical protein
MTPAHTALPDELIILQSIPAFLPEAPDVPAMMEEYKSPNNAVTLTIDLIEPFMDNKFGIDVDVRVTLRSM